MNWPRLSSQVQTFRLNSGKLRHLPGRFPKAGSHLAVITTINKIRSSSGVRQTTGMTSNSGKLRHPLERFLWVGSHLAMIVTINKIRFSSVVARLISGIMKPTSKKIRISPRHQRMRKFPKKSWLMAWSCVLKRRLQRKKGKSGKLKLLRENIKGFLGSETLSLGLAGNHLLLIAMMNLIRSSFGARQTTGITSKSGK